MEPVPLDMTAKMNTLKASKIGIVSIGFNKPDTARYLWLYIYDANIMATRINCPSIKSKENEPSDCSSMHKEL
jgi:hypothetical protein